ncbi:MAG TPA: preprotein translocase subunit YajC [Alphaproteobacteria bacterium]|nr:preprotein translocase subunit YajC [Alphaproteobacteria bacterium]
MLISEAYAQAAGGAPGGFDIMSIAPLVLIFVVFYFLLIRPQQKKAKEHKAMLSALRRGDKVVTGGGILGTVSKVVGDDEVLLEIAPEVKIRVMRATIQTVVSRTEPASDKGKGDKGKDEPAKDDKDEDEEDAGEAAAKK